MAQHSRPTPPSGHPSQEGRVAAHFIGYQPYLKELARQLRQNMTRGEVILWNRLKARRMCGYAFNRQRPIDHYIVDFYCKKLMLAIEIDGSSHDSEIAQHNDYIRQTRLESFGVRFLRFREREVCQNTDHVLQTIHQWIHQHTMPLPSSEGCP